MRLFKLIEFVRGLHTNNAIHKKRGFKLNEVSPTLITNHLVEEVVELQAEVIEVNYDGIVDESADVLAVWLHLLNVSDVKFQDVVDKCYEKLSRTFTYDEDDILTDTPGTTRRHRKGEAESSSLATIKNVVAARKVIDEARESRQIACGGQGLEDIGGRRESNPASDKFHELWGRSIGKAGYVKQDWQDMATMINELGGNV